MLVFELIVGIGLVGFGGHPQIVDRGPVASPAGGIKATGLRAKNGE